MNGPGWYHAQGDPVDTLRYWDGQAWRGDAEMRPHGIVYFDAGPTQVDLGDIATQKPLAERAGGAPTLNSSVLTPYSVAEARATAKLRELRRRKWRRRFMNLLLVGLVGLFLRLLFFTLGVLAFAVAAILIFLAMLRHGSAKTTVGSGMRTSK